MIPALSALSIGQKIAGVVVSLALWLAPAGAVWLHMHGRISAERALGRADCEKANAQALAAANHQQIEDWKTAQAAVNKQARDDARAISAKLKEDRERAASAMEDLSAYAAAHPLPAGCRADARRVQLVNKARGQD